MLLCYITDRSRFPGTEPEKRKRLLEKIAECAGAGVDYIQLREKDLSARDLEQLALRAMSALPRNSTAKLLINSRADVALACGAHGVHLPAADLTVGDARGIFSRCGRPAVIGVSTHSMEEVLRAENAGANFALFGPVFEKSGQANLDGLQTLREICHRRIARMPVFALGGVTLENTRPCLQAGAAGIAAIRLFQDNNDVTRLVQRLRT
ncbi:MAG TPA: thiamine phosphate synthase [Alphaproteobacteria bacterium]|nr:thiamine phosphate synthase [Alphaproteobacteria bacterium]